MGEYNYSPWLLEAKKELLDYLLDLARTGQQAKAVFDTAIEAKRYRHEILELLANLTRNQPDQAPLRSRIRTNIRYEGERYAVYVGMLDAVQKLRGARPQLPAGVSYQTAQGNQLTGDVLSIPGVMDTTARVIGLMAKLTEAKTRTKPDYIQFEEPLPPEGVEHVVNHLAPEYEPIKTTPKLIFERQRTNIDASAIIASALRNKQP